MRRQPRTVCRQIAARTAGTSNDIKNPWQDIPWPRAAIAPNWVNGGPMSLNDFTLSIKRVGTPENPPAEARFASAIALSAYWRDGHGIEPSRGRTLRHSDVNSVDRSHCANLSFDRARVITTLGGDLDWMDD